MKIMMEWNPKFFKNNGSHIEEFIDWIKNHHFKVYDILNNGDLKLIKVEDLFKKDFSDLLLVPAE
jgi:hypothetical protein